MGADSGGLVGQPGPARCWLLPPKAHGSWYFLKLELPAQLFTCAQAQGDSDLAIPNSNIWGAILMRGQGTDAVLAT